MSDRDGKIDPLTINLIPGNKAPRFDAAMHALTPLAATITEQGMASGLPMVDVVFVDNDGERCIWTTSGRMILALAAALRGVNLRNHGTEEP